MSDTASRSDRSVEPNGTNTVQEGENATSLRMAVEVTLKPGSNQSQAEAEAEFIKLFREYLTNEEGAFQCDYGPDAWGGYDGPTVTSVEVRDPEEPAGSGPSGPAERT
ncbi:hypothetical protein [Arthrobacter sp. AD-310]